MTKKRRLTPPADDDSAEVPTIHDKTVATDLPDLAPAAEDSENAEDAPGAASGRPGNRAARFAALKKRATESSRSNLAEAKAEAQRGAVDPTVLANLSRRSAIAQHKLLKADTEADEGEGAFERKRAWDYTIEESEKWDERMARKKNARDKNVFQDYGAEAGKIYDRQIRELEKSGTKDRDEYLAQKANLIEEAARNGGLEIIETKDGELVAVDKNGTFYADQNDTSFIESKPKKENVDRLVEELRKAEEVRLKKRRARGLDQDEGDVTFINEKNKQFNMKLARFYDKYTKDIRESFERGTAL